MLQNKLRGKNPRTNLLGSLKMVFCAEPRLKLGYMVLEIKWIWLIWRSAFSVFYYF
jgi:hypothetical protein